MNNEEEIKVLLRRNLELAKENNKLLKKIKRSATIGLILRIAWWAILIGVPVALYYYVLQPYINELSETYRGIQQGVEGAEQRLLSIPFIGDFLGSFFDSGGATSSPQ